MYSIFAKNNYLISNFISYIKFHLFSDSVYYRYRGIILIVRGRPVPRVSLMAFLLLASGGGGGGRDPSSRRKKSCPNLNPRYYSALCSVNPNNATNSSYNVFARSAQRGVRWPLKAYCSFFPKNRGLSRTGGLTMCSSVARAPRGLTSYNNSRMTTKPKTNN